MEQHTVSKKVKEKLEDARNKNQLQRILTHLERNNGEATEPELYRIIDCPRSTLQFRLDRLTSMGLIKRVKQIGAHKTRENLVMLIKPTD
jgi:uncharacterized membrane protein